MTTPAMAAAQAVDVLTQLPATNDDTGQPYTVESALALVLKTRQEAGLPIPTPTEVTRALDVLRRQREAGDAEA